MVFTSTSGGPTSAAIRSMTLRVDRVDRVGHFAPDAVRQLLQPILAPVGPDYGEPGGGQFLRRRAAELTARADHDRYTLAHAFLLPVVFSFTTGMVRRRHRIPVIYHLGAAGSGKTSLLHASAERAGQLRRLAPDLSSCPAAGCRVPTGLSGPGRA
jgi:hypothetical protein